VQKAQIFGDRTFAMRVWLKPDKMAALGISPSQVSNALAATTTRRPRPDQGDDDLGHLVANTNLETADEFKKLVVKEDNGTVVRLADVADVVLGAENYEQEVSFNGQTAVFMAVYVLPTANTLDVMKRVRAAMPEIQAQLPAGMSAAVPYDSSEYIQEAINEVLKTLAETLLIVVFVISSLGSVRGVIIPSSPSPSRSSARTADVDLRFTINLLTLLAVVLSVVSSSTTPSSWWKHRAASAHGQDAVPGCHRRGARARRAIIAMTITLAAVYTPVALQVG